MFVAWYAFFNPYVGVALCVVYPVAYRKMPLNPESSSDASSACDWRDRRCSCGRCGGASLIGGLTRARISIFRPAYRDCCFFLFLFLVCFSLVCFFVFFACFSC